MRRTNAGRTAVVLSSALALTCLLLADEHPARPGQPGAKPSAAKTHPVTIKNFKFEPPEINIAVGDSITWTNEDGAPHSATRTTAPAFDTGLLAKGKSATITFNNSGSIEYFCLPHPTMRGRVNVKLAGSDLGNPHEPTLPPTPAAARRDVSVEIFDREPYYVPAAVEIHVGDSITWVNRGQAVHTATRTSAPAFNTGPLGTGAQKTITFNEATAAEGVEYICTPHPFMKGRVVVKLAGSHLLTNHAAKQEKQGTK